MSSNDPMQLLETTLENGQPIDWDTTLIVFHHHQFRRGSVAGIEERRATGTRTVKVRGTVEHDWGGDKGETRKSVANVPDMVHLDSPDTGRTRFLTWDERHRLRELWDYAVRTGQTGSAAPPTSMFLPPGKSKDDVIDDAVWTRGDDKDTGQTDTKGPGSPGSAFQTTGQGADDGQGVAAEEPPDNPFGGASQVPDKDVSGGKNKDRDGDGVLNKNDEFPDDASRS